MGKIVKFCSSCDEGFAEKFTFCPDCGQPLQAFEMNPVAKDAPQAEAVLAAPVEAERADLLEIPVAAEAQNADIDPVEETVLETAPAVAEPEIVEEPVIEAAPVVEEIERIEEPVVEAAPIAEEIEEIEEPVTKVAAPKAAAAAATSLFIHSKPIDVDRKPTSLEAEHEAYAAEGGFYVTVIEEKNNQRNKLLLGALGFTIIFWLSAVVVSIYSKDLDVLAINDDIFNAVIVDDIPMTVEEEEKQKKDKDAGGGGGGGKEEKEETTQGDLADQSKNPTRPPDAKVYRSDNFELKMPPPQTEGNQTYEKKFDRWGDPNGRFASFSNGTGSGGGQGSGTGTGQGSGRGTGNGSGDGSGSGSGIGNGNGSGTGDGDYGPPPPSRPKVTTNLAILSKPRPGYTDAARQANIQGTVILRVTFLGSGQIGGISAVKGLPNGLTEQAIAAARRISFTPKMIDGVPQSVTKQIEYTFSIY